KPAEAYSPLSLETLNAERLPIGFTGLPAESITDALAKVIGLDKGEFETTADFEARKAAAISRPYIPNLTLEDLHAFVLNVVKWERYSSGVAYRYNADDGDVE